MDTPPQLLPLHPPALPLVAPDVVDEPVPLFLLPDTMEPSCRPHWRSVLILTTLQNCWFRLALPVILA